MKWFLISFPVFWLGLGNRYPFVWFGEAGRAVGAWFWIFLTTVWIVGFFYEFRNRVPRFFVALKSNSLETWARWYLCISVFLTPALDVFQSVHFKALGYQFPWGLLILDSIGLLWVTFTILRKRPFDRIWFVVSVAFACFHTMGSIVAFPITPHRSDMLATIGIAAHSFLSGGQAYSAHLEGWRYGIGYLPGMWMSFLPAAALKIDLRWMNVFWFALIGIFAWRHIAAKAPRAIPYFLLWFFNPYLHFRHDLYLHFFWAICLVTSVWVIQRRRVLALITVSISALTMIWAWVFAPFWVMAISRSKRELVTHSIGVGLAIVMGLGFFYHREGQVFVDAVTVFFRIVVGDDYNREYCLGYSLGMSHLGLHRWMSVFQKLAVIAAGVWGLIQWHRGKSVVAFGLVTFWGFCLTVEHQENYQYLLPMLLMPTLFLIKPNSWIAK